jgi:hypothetical protein
VVVGVVDLYRSDEYAGRLRELLIAVASDLPLAMVVSIDEMIDANQTHEALDVLVDALSDLRIAVDADTADLIAELSSLFDAAP